jgi:hypothetical protein
MGVARLSRTPDLHPTIEEGSHELRIRARLLFDYE